jgi:hypothetical protein
VPATSPDAGSGDLVISWAAPDDRGSAVSAYRIEVRDQLGSAWSVSPNCDGSAAAVVAARACSVPMLSLLAAPYSYTLGALVVVRVAAENEKGWGLVSGENTAGATATTLPAQASAPTRGDATTPAEVEVQWTALTGASSTGGLAITSYHLEYDRGSGESPGGASWQSLLGDPSASLLLEYTATGAGVVTGGTTYQFRVRAANVLGWGPWSAVVAVLAAAPPGQMASLSTEIDPGLDPLSVKISWTAPDANGDALAAYEVQIREQGGAEFSATGTCDGAVSAVVSARYCLVALTTLAAPDYSLVYGDLVVARARARNSIGWGPYSQPNAAGATVQTAPSAMTAPTRGATTLTSVALSWLALTGDGTGGAAIAAYELSYGTGLTGSTWAPLPAEAGAAPTALTYALTGLTPGDWYRFRVRAQNAHGWGPYSPTTTAQAANVPDQPAAATTSLLDASVRIAWAAPSNNYKAITAYVVEIRNAAGSHYYAQSSYCDGSTAAVVASLHCDVPVSVLRASPYELARGGLVVARLRAVNELGPGLYSPDNTAGAAVETEPDAMPSPTRGAATGTSSVELAWTALTSPEDGLSPVTTYALDWDAGAGSAGPWSSLVGEASDYLLTSYVVTAGVSAGTAYRFRLRAANFWGWGEYSSVVVVYAATSPGQPAAPSTSVEATAGAIVIAWVAPDSRGDAISSYTLELRGAAPGGVWTAETTYCGGPTALTCTLPMSVVLAAPYSLAQGDLVEARVTAVNSHGAGQASAANSAGADVRVAPLAVGAPSRGASTATTQVEVEWPALTAPGDGGSAVTSYHVQWDQGTGSWADLVGLVSPHTQTAYTVTTGVTSGASHQFRVRAANVYGWGPYSPVTAILASQAPAQPQVPTTAIVGTAARIAWTAPAANGEAITAYEVLVLQSDGTTFTAEPVACDGGSAGVVASRQCDIPLQTLRAAPYSLSLGSLVQAKVRASNGRGPGPYSQVNAAGALVQTEPAAVTGLAFDAAASTAAAIRVTWTELTALADTGRATISGYELEMAEAGAAPSWSTLATVAPGLAAHVATGLTGGAGYLFRVRATNAHGEGPYSAEISALAADVPGQPAAPSTAQVATGVRVSWAAPSANHLAIEEYEVTIADASGAFAERPTLCDGSGGTVVTDLACVIPMASLTGAPLSLAVGTLIEAKVRARNLRGWGPASAANSAGVLAQAPPTGMAAPSTDPAQTGEAAVYVAWAALTTSAETGGSPATSYHLQWDAGTPGGAWADLQGAQTASSPASLATSALLTSAIAPGGVYTFRVRASNVHGWGAWSSGTAIKAAQVPHQMAAATTSIDAATGGLAIAWVAPADGSDPIDRYLVEVETAGGAWQATPTGCDGTDAAIVAGAACVVPMSALTGAPVSLGFDVLAVARVSAGNAYGLGAASPGNTAGARTRRAPDQMPPPGLVSVAEAQIALSWAALGAPADGNSAVTAYNVYWDNGGGSTDIALLDSLSTSVTVPGLTGGVSYKFKVRARNIYGDGDFSPELVVLASDRPGAVAIPSVTIGAADTDVTIAWAAPDDHSAAIDAYEVHLRVSDGTYTAACDGSDAAIRAARSCAVPMATARSLTGLAVDSLLRVRVRAQNSNGWGAYSELNTAGATVEDVPGQLAMPTFDAAASTTSQVALSWAAATGVAAGGSSLSVTNYVLEWDAGSGSWGTHLTTTSTSATSTGLSGGTLYQYRVAAANKHGTGPVSPALAVVAAQAPSTPAAPTTASETIYVKVAWSAPSANHAAIDAYQILIADGAGGLVEDTANCDGAEPSVRDALYCLIPMTALWAPPFSLPQGALVAAQVKARNERGWSGTSPANSAGADVEAVPH